ncbi:MAG: thioredoxin family protein [Thiomicrorhabdus sp.]|nr:thioredoxin family protein [Thiomicrorhabdus sp.]
MKGNLMVRLMTLIILVAIGLAHISGQTDLLSVNWLWLAVLPAFMGLQATFTGWCPAEMIGKLSKTGECCPGGSCGTSKPTTSQAESTSSSCCGSENTSEKEATSSCCGSETASHTEQNGGCCDTREQLATSSGCCSNQNEVIEIKVLGTGCSNCNNTAKLIEATAKEMGLTVNVIKVEEVADIAAYGVMSTPGVVIREQVVHAGGVPTKKAVIEWLQD